MLTNEQRQHLELVDPSELAATLETSILCRGLLSINTDDETVQISSRDFLDLLCSPQTIRAVLKDVAAIEIGDDDA